MRITSPIKIQGKKSKLIPKIKDNVDLSKTYIEPFLGSGEVLLNLNPEKAIVSDNNVHIINFFKGIQDGTITHEKVRSFLEHHGEILRNEGREYYYEMRKIFNETHDSFHFLFINRSCFNGVMRFNSKGEFNVPFCNNNNRFAKALVTKIVNQVKAAQELILNRGDNWEFRHSDWEELFNEYDGEDSFFYYDPPYVDRTRTYFNEWTEESNQNLFDKISNMKSDFVLSNWYANKYRENASLMNTFKEDDYKFIYIEHFYHVGGNIENRNSIIECLVKKK